MLLAVLITCAMPSAVMWTIRLFKEDARAPSVKALIGSVMIDNLIYLKFMLDPFVYAWRMKKYLEALYKSIGRQKTGQDSTERQNNAMARKHQEVVEMTTPFASKPSSGSMVTLLSFKTLENKGYFDSNDGAKNGCT